MGTTFFQKPKPGLDRWVAAFRNSRNGFLFACKHEAAFREELIVILLSIPLAFVVAINLIHACVLIGGLIFLLIVEVLNSAIEVTVDRISLEMHILSGAAKDLGSLAVMLAITLNLVLWGISLYHWWVS